MADYNLKAIITGDASGYETAVNKAKKASENLSTSINKISKLMTTAFSVVGISASISSITRFGKECVKSAESANKSLSILNNTLKVTGADAWTTSEDLVKMSEEIANSTNYTVGEIQDMQSVLLGFKNITGDTFREASDAITDMATVMGMDLKSAVQTVGKALDDPIKGLDSLRRQGFAFTEEQKEELKQLVENGEQLKAQKIILDELNTTYGGAAKSAQSSFDRQKDAIISFKETLGNQLIPVLDVFAEKSATSFSTLTEKIKTIDFSEIAGTVEYSVKVITEYFGVFYNNAKELVKGLTDRFEGVEISMDSVKNAIYNALNNIYKQMQISFGFIKSLINGDWKLAWEYAKIYVLNVCKKILDGLDGLLQKMPELVNGAIKGLNAYYEAQDKVLIEWFHLPEKFFKAPRLGTYDGKNFIDTSELQKQIDEATKIIEEATGKQVTVNLTSLEKIDEYRTKYQKKTEEGEIHLTDVTKTETKKIYDELGDYKKKKGKEEGKDEKSKFETMLEYAKQYAKQVASVFKNIVSNIKNIFSKAGNIFMKIIEFNPDEALDNLLKFEDAILTFFVETLPKLPAFFKSAMQSIIVLIDTVLNVLDFDAITEIVSEIFETIISAITKWVGSGGWKKLLDTFLKLQQKIENVIADNLPAIVDTIVAMLPDLEDTLSKSIVSASKTLGKIAKPLFKVIIAVIMTLLELLNDDDVIDAMVDAIGELVAGLFEAIIEMLPQFLSKTAPKIIKMVIRSLVKLPIEIANSILKGLISAFTKINWGQVVKDIFTGFIDGIKDLFGIHSPSTLFESFGKYMIEGLILGIQGMADALNSVLQPIYNLVVNIFGQIGNIITSSISVSFSGLTSLLGGINSGIAQITNSVANLINSLANLISTAKQAVSALNPLSGGSGGGDNREWYKKTFDPFNLFSHANGTNNAPKGLSIVGEAGPELVRFRGGEQVLNNRNTNKALENMGGKTNNFNVTFNNLQDTTAFNMMQQLKAYNRQMAINGII